MRLVRAIIYTVKLRQISFACPSKKPRQGERGFLCACAREVGGYRRRAARVTVLILLLWFYWGILAKLRRNMRSPPQSFVFIG